MALTDSRRRANNKYIAKNYTVLGVKIRKDDAETFKAACKAAGTTPNSVFKAAIDDFMRTRAAPEDAAAPEDNYNSK